MERLTAFDGEFWIHKNFPPVEGDRVDEFIDCVKDLASRLAKIENILGDEYDLERLKELVEADKEGRCFTLPCKPSNTTVYQIRGKKHARGSGISLRHISCATVWEGGDYELNHQGAEPCRRQTLGKTWFLDKASAEAALEKMKEREK